MTKHFERPIKATAVEPLYKALLKDSKWTWKLIEVLKDNLLASKEPDMKHWWPEPKEFDMVFERHPELKDRVMIAEKNGEFKKKNWKHISWADRCGYMQQDDFRDAESTQSVTLPTSQHKRGRKARTASRATQAGDNDSPKEPELILNSRGEPKQDTYTERQTNHAKKTEKNDSSSLKEG